LEEGRALAEEALLKLVEERLRLGLISDGLKVAHEAQDLLVVFVDLREYVALLAIAFDGAYAAIGRIVTRVL
jgi:hypothetical protein